MRRPDFLIVGAMKSGTTACTIHLDMHPEIQTARLHHSEFLYRDEGLRQTKSIQYLAKLDEIHFFSNDTIYRLGETNYLSVFADGNMTGKVRGEKTPAYLRNPKACERIHKCCPDAKIIICLRNPIDRTLSHWNHMNGVKDIAPWVPDAMKKVIDDFEACVSLAEKQPWNCPILMPSAYHEAVKRFLDTFGKEQVHITIQERTLSNHDQTYDRMFEFLEVRPMRVSRGIYHSRPHAAMSHNMRTHLAQIFAEDVQKTKELLGDDIPEWEDFLDAP
jgi:hypothetical protein